MTYAETDRIQYLMPNLVPENSVIRPVSGEEKLRRVMEAVGLDYSVSVVGRTLYIISPPEVRPTWRWLN